MKVLFMNGPSQDPSDRFFGWPTPLLYAMAPTVEAVRRGDLEVELADEIFDPWCWVDGQNDELIKGRFRGSLKGIDVLCASSIYDALYPTLQLFAEAKRMDPRIITILGGPHFDETHSLLPPVRLDLGASLVDYAIAGDGDIVLRELLRELSLKRKPDLQCVIRRSYGRAWLYDSKGRVAITRTPLDLNKLPCIPIEYAAEIHRLDYDIFRDESGIIPVAQMIAARGCPFSCTCCSERRQLAIPNARSIESVIREIELRKQQGFKGIFFDDSTFSAYPHLLHLLHELGKTGMRFGCLNRFSLMREPHIAEMFKKAGFDYMYCAIEQFDDLSLMHIQKAQDMESIERGMRSMQQVGIRVGVSLLFGIPFETPDSIRRTLDFTQEWIEKGVVSLVSMSLLSFHPGTPNGVGAGDFNRTPPNIEYPWNQFEEGQWYHPPHVTEEYVRWIIHESEKRFSSFLSRKRHSWGFEHRRKLSGL